MVDTLNNAKLVSNPMSVQEMYSQLLSQEVVELVRSGQYFSEVETEPLVRKWIKSIREEDRPNPVSVIMNSKRTLWGLSRI